MVDITHKATSLRQAIASARIIVSQPSTIEAVLAKSVPKGDVFEFSRAAGMLAIKKTSDLIPDCHPLPIEYASIKHSIEGLSIVVTVEVHTIYKTGVEVEAMHGASVTALTIYDMLKPLDKGLEITSIKLLSKTGGKSDFKQEPSAPIKAVVLICSDTISAGINKDKTGAVILEQLAQYKIEAELQIIPDKVEIIRECAKKFSDNSYDLILFAGGTGLSPKDLTPDAIRPMLDREIPGIMEAARNYGQQRTPMAMLSRGVSGFIKNSLIITLPGSPRGALESMNAVFPYVLHVFKVARGQRHD
jgi:cyclic pyranopterin monophosphate synthase